MATTSTSKTEQLTGVIKTVTYHNEETGYFVVKVDVSGKGERTVTGTTPVIHVGELLTATGVVTPSKWGMQLKASRVQLSVPDGLEGIEKWLANAIDGIGKGFAKKMAEQFGRDVYRIIEEEPERLLEIKRLGKSKADAIVAGYHERKGKREIEEFLFKVGLSPKRATRVFERYGADAVEKIKANPYLLCRDVWGIGFKTADEAARKQGIPADSEYRVRAGIQHVLTEAQGRGSCGIPVDVMLERASELMRVDYDLIERCIQFEIEADEVVRDGSNGIECLFSRKVYDAENELAELLMKHANRVVAHKIADVDSSILDAELNLGITLDETQRDAVRAALLSQVVVITGGPGTGKTTITQVILEVMKSEGLEPILLAAPTGKAAKRAAEATGFDSSTLHRMLEMQRNGGFKYNKANPLEAECITLDETSMVDIFLCVSVLRALPANARLLIIGDENQLSSVGVGKVLGDIIASGAVPTVKLTKVFRQAAQSDIVRAAHAVNAGEMPELGYKEGSDFCFTNISPRNPKDESEKEKVREQIEAEVLRLARDMYKLGYDPIKEVQVLAPMRRGTLGFASLNVRLQAILNPTPAAKVEWNKSLWGTGDKVMQLRNNYDKAVFNGDIGYIDAIDTSTATLTVQYDDRFVVYKFSELDELTLAYAFSIHKSQGSEFPVVIMPIDTSHYMMLQRAVIYTGMTRAKKLCVCVGQPLALQMAVRNAQNDERYTRLKELLRGALPKDLRQAA
jgi:exodeoxyribonuclease V alpha subunit